MFFRKMSLLLACLCGLLLASLRPAHSQAALYLQNSATGQLAVWYMLNTSVTGASYLTPGQDPAWTCVGDGYFTSNGNQLDLIFQDFSTGELAIWYLNGVTATSGSYVTPTQDPAWRCVGVNSFNGTGKHDLLFQSTTTGQLAIWYMSGNTRSSGAFVTPTPAAGWACVGTGNFNDFTSPDLVLQNITTGQLVIWFMNGANRSGSVTLSPAQDPHWPCVAVMAPAGSNQQLLIFQNQSTGALAYWILNGTTVESGGYLPTPPPGWKVVAPR